MGSVSLRPHPQSRQAFTMIELVIVLGIIVILAALGVGASQELLPRFRARKAAKMMAADISRARMSAMMNNREAQFAITDFDTDPTDVESPSYGAWSISVGNKTMGSSCWDILPFEDNSCTDSYTSLGLRDIKKGSTDYQRQVGLEEPDITTLTFNPRGWVTNDAADFTYGDDNGYVEYRFYNKVSASKGITEDHFAVRVYRSGMVRIESGMNEDQYENDAGGTAQRSSAP